MTGGAANIMRHNYSGYEIGKAATVRRSDSNIRGYV